MKTHLRLHLLCLLFLRNLCSYHHLSSSLNQIFLRLPYVVLFFLKKKIQNLTFLLGNHFRKKNKLFKQTKKQRNKETKPTKQNEMKRAPSLFIKHNWKKTKDLKSFNKNDDNYDEHDKKEIKSQGGEGGSIIENIENITCKLNQTPTQLFIKQFIYSNLFIHFFVKISVSFCRNFENEYVLVKEKKNFVDYEELWKFHKSIWLRKTEKEETLMIFKKNEDGEYNDLYNLNSHQMKSIEIELTNYFSLFSNDINNSSSSNDEKIKLYFHINSSTKSSSHNSILINLTDFNRKQLSLFLAILNQTKQESHYDFLKEEKKRKMSKDSYSLELKFNYFSHENFILEYHVFILLLIYVKTPKSLLFALQSLNSFLEDPLSIAFMDDPRRKALLTISARLSLTASEYSSNQQSSTLFNFCETNNKFRSIQDEVIYIIQNTVKTACSEGCYCCQEYLNKLWMSL